MDLEKLSKPIYIKLEIVRGWWTQYEEGEQPFIYKILDKNNNKQEVSVPLGDTMYFHVEVKRIAIDEKLELKLYDYDELFFKADILDPDDDKFPNDPVIEETIINQVREKSDCTIINYTPPDDAGYYVFKNGTIKFIAGGKDINYYVETEEDSNTFKKKQQH